MTGQDSHGRWSISGLETSEWVKRQQSWTGMARWHFSLPLKTLPSAPPHSGWQEAGPVSANQQPDRTRALSSVALATSFLFWIPLLYTWYSR